jgi:16S rRNA C1402 (ribose-2'-O) methylase RsmI
MHDSTLVPSDFIKEPDILNFFMDDINNLASYEPGNPENKPDVIKQIAEMKQNREVMIQEHIKKQAEHMEMMNKLQIASSLPAAQNKINEMGLLIQQLTLENNQLTEKVKYLEDKMKQIISDRVKEKMQERRITLSQEAPTITSLS